VRFLFLLLFLPAFAHAQALSIGQFSIGQSSVKVNLSDFTINKNLADISAQFVNGSIQWIRTEDNLLTPRALLNISLPKKFHPAYFKSAGQNIFPTTSELTLSTQIYVNLFQPQVIQIYQNDQLLDSIQIRAKSVAHSKTKQWIDHSCAPYLVTVIGADNEYSSTGCKMNRIGRFGSETPRLEVTFSSPNLETPFGDKPPFTFNLNNNQPVETVLINKSTQSSATIKVSAKLPQKLHRLKLAGGIGPYVFTSQYGLEKIKDRTAPSYMLYGKFELTETSSFKAFDALLYDNRTLFNNSGLYYSYDLAQVYDGQIIFGALLGFQGLHFRHDNGRPTEFDIIYPQGFELTYNHAFGWQNFYLSYGMFVSTTEELYRNIWLRGGGKVFYELNYITWGSDVAQIEMWGLSIGFPLFQAF
jgi:hypothetical protein